MQHAHQPVHRAGLPDPLRTAFAAHAEARGRGMPVAEVLGEHAEDTRRERARRAGEEHASGGRTTGRRRLLGVAGAAALAAALPGGLLTPRRAAAATGAAAPRVVIVGAGLAGLRCAHRLWNQGNPVATTVYEADTTRIGGRCWSLRGFFSGGAVHEHELHAERGRRLRRARRGRDQLPDLIPAARTAPEPRAVTSAGSPLHGHLGGITAAGSAAPTGRCGPAPR